MRKVHQTASTTIIIAVVRNFDPYSKMTSTRLSTPVCPHCREEEGDLRRLELVVKQVEDYLEEEEETVTRQHSWWILSSRNNSIG